MTLPTTTDALRDEVLVLQAQQGQAEALAELVRRWQDRLWQRAFRVTRDQEAARDIVQNTWRKALAALPALLEPAAFPGWILRITNNLAIDWIRREARQRSLHESYAAVNAGEPDPAETAVAAVRAAIARLVPRDSEIVGLFYIDGLPVAAIAETLGLPPGTVKSRLHHARAELKRLLKQEESR